MKPLANKVLVLGIDGLDPELTRKYVDEGYMPNMKKFLEMGSARADIKMMGCQPTVTPPMWTSLATGAHPYTHGITEYYACDPERLDVLLYNFDSQRCTAEPMWNVAAEAGKKTLVWHWPGSSWPPTSDSENLTVVDGTQPAGPNTGVAEVDPEKLLVASVETHELRYGTKAATDSQIPCFIPGMEVEESNELTSFDKVHAHEVTGVALTSEESYHNLSDTPFDICFSPIKDAVNWANAPEGAKECTLLNASGKIHRPCLILKNENGIYDRVAVYKNKKATEPIVVCEKDVFMTDVIDDAYRGEDKIQANRNMRLIDIAEDGSTLRLWVSAGMDFTNDTLWHPKSVLKDIVANVGCPQPVSMAGGSDERLISKCVNANWTAAANWNANSIKYLARTKGYEVIFSHFHNVDLQGHLLVKFLYEGSNKLAPEVYQRLFRDVYVQTDDYIGQFLEMIDEGWTILIMSDHGQVSPAHDMPYWGEISGVNIVAMEEMGYTVMKTDEKGNKLPEIDWTKTRAVAQREGHIYINLKGREKTGIVDPKDKYELEEQIMTDMYAQRDPQTGKRVIALALRNRDAVLLGQGGPDAGDICYWNAEGYNYDHGDSLSTCWGEEDTSSSPIFVAAGLGIKENYVTDRIIRQIDFAPTIAAILGVRMPAQCEGAPAYQILSEEF